MGCADKRSSNGQKGVGVNGEKVVCTDHWRSNGETGVGVSGGKVVCGDNWRFNDEIGVGVNGENVVRGGIAGILLQCKNTYVKIYLFCINIKCISEIMTINLNVDLTT